MAVCAKNIFVADTFRLIFTVITIARDNFSQRLDTVTQKGTSAVVLKANDNRAAGKIGAAKSVVSNHSTGTAHSVKVHSTQKIASMTGGIQIIVSQHLISAADGENGFPIFDGRDKAFIFTSVQIFKKDLLLKVLTSAKEEQIKLCKRLRFADREICERNINSTPHEPVFYADNIARVPIEVQNIGIQMTYFQFHDATPKMLCFRFSWQDCDAAPS